MVIRDTWEQYVDLVVLHPVWTVSCKITQKCWGCKPISWLVVLPLESKSKFSSKEIINAYSNLKHLIQSISLSVLLLILSLDFLPVGEDGQVKIWSRSGMLRSTLVQAGLCTKTLIQCCKFLVLHRLEISWGRIVFEWVSPSTWKVYSLACKTVSWKIWPRHLGLNLKVWKLVFQE